MNDRGGSSMVEQFPFKELVAGSSLAHPTLYASIVQRIGQGSSKASMLVRFQLDAHVMNCITLYQR